MMKACSAECRTKTPLNEKDIFRIKQKGWIDDGTFVATKEQQAKLGLDDFNAIQRVGDKLYGKGCK